MTSDIYDYINIITFILFLGGFFALYLLIRTVSNSTIATRLLDLLSFVVFMATIIHYFTNISPGQVASDSKRVINSLELYFNHWKSIVYLLVCLLLLYIMIYMTGVSMTQNSKPITIMFVEVILLIGITIATIVQFFKVVLGISFVNVFSSWITTNVYVYEVAGGGGYSGNTVSRGNTISSGNTMAANPVTTSPIVNEVFNIRNNLYSYKDAQSVCKVYGARLATYDEVEEAYNKGAEWCNYGWSEDQTAYFPTQQKTWEEIQKSDPENKGKCGRPGVNGGYMVNPYLRLGVNCYGKKPKSTKKENIMLLLATPPPSPEEELEKSKIDFLSQHKDDMLSITSFNYDKWSASDSK